MASNFRWLGKSKDGESIVLKRFSGSFVSASHATPAWLAQNEEMIRKGITVDLETTGINRENDRIIEIGIRPFLFDRGTGEVLKVEEGYSALEDPKQPLSPTITRLTGITDQELEGQEIDWKKVSDLLRSAHIVIAHNAGFDRPFLDRYCSVSREKIWACSAKQISWTENGFHSAKLELLNVFHGFFVDSHRALSDADALLHLLSHTAPEKKSPYLKELIQNARQPYVHVTADQSPYESKDLLKSRGYRWNSQKKVWHRSINKENREDEIAWLESCVYRGDFLGSAFEVPLTENFKRPL